MNTHVAVGDEARPAFDSTMHESCSIKGLFLMIEAELSGCPSNAFLVIAVLKDLALKNDPGWQQRTFGFLKGVWAMGRLDEKRLAKLENNLYRFPIQ
ncbi:hypothetical protein LOY52_14545 [Pseudomonas sp. B21-051]|uniref:hypothetical protein n=1 Tax=Pseudomonas sp. B21-051 TaxID=2895491 RepID=UPI0021605B85|nr:hypothetical protein [Pseudomonas sp. B21-051]UVK86114.1 hypothetical protein LOY52_14545 [Pseudomonas sp. B21-051]